MTVIFFTVMSLEAETEKREEPLSSLFALECDLVFEKIAWLRAILAEKEKPDIRGVNLDYLLANLDSDFQQLVVLVKAPQAQELVFPGLKSERAVTDGRSQIVRHINSASDALTQFPPSPDRKTFLTRIADAEAQLRLALEVLPARIREK